MSYSKHRVLLLEDNPADAELARLAFAELVEPVDLMHFSNGQECVEKLRKLPSDEIICLILDINIPNISGLDVLRMLRELPECKFLPVVVFSSSDLPEDVSASYDAGADAYLVKPAGFDAFCNALQRLIDFWRQPEESWPERPVMLSFPF